MSGISWAASCLVLSPKGTNPGPDRISPIRPGLFYLHGCNVCPERHDCMDAGGRAMPGAIAEDACRDASQYAQYLNRDLNAGRDDLQGRVLAVKPDQHLRMSGLNTGFFKR